MKSATVEKLKTWLLAGLILSSVVLLGIHWRQQSDWFPFRFVTALFAGEAADDLESLETMRWDCIRPSRMYVYEAAKAQWMLPSSTPSYSRIWNDVRSFYFPAVVDAKPVSLVRADAWSDLISSGDTVLEFHSPIPFSLIKWLSSRKELEPDDDMMITKMAIQPSEDVNASVQTILALTDKGVYKYLIDIPNEALPKSLYQSILKTAKSNRQSISMSMLGAFGSIAANPDILVNFLSKAQVYYPTLTVSLPESLQIHGTDIESVQENVLLDLKDSLIARMDVQTGDAVFSDIDNEYRLTRHGLLTYKRTSRTEPDAGSLAQAFEQSLAFIEDRKTLWPDMEIVLTNVETKRDRYVFSFAYTIGDLLVRLKPERNSAELAAPIIIEAGADGVTACSWQTAQLSVGDSAAYSLFFVDLLNDILPEAHPEALPNREAGRNLESLDYGYVLDMQALRAAQAADAAGKAQASADSASGGNLNDLSGGNGNEASGGYAQPFLTMTPNWLVTIAGQLYVLPLREEQE